MDPYQRLAAAIIQQAVIDLGAPKANVRVRAFGFLNNSASLRSWCDLLDLDPAAAIASAIVSIGRDRRSRRPKTKVH